jgi:Flp pilus assembly protein TadG
VSRARLVGRWVESARGIAALEFALLAPVLILLYFGAVELTQGFMAQQRVSHTASTVGDLVSQSSTLTTDDIADIFSVGQTTMYPYATTTLGMRVSSVSEDANGNAMVAWSEASGVLQPLSKNAPYSDANLSNVLSANQTIIVAQAQYAYSSVFSYVLPTPITFNETYYLKPRLSTSVTCSDC